MRSGRYDEFYNSRNFRGMAGRSFSSVTCCGVPAVKWVANKDPAQDKAAILALETVLRTVKAERFILISTVDVYSTPVDVDEEHLVMLGEGSPYGRHRYDFEVAVRRLFPATVVLRLPALYGPGLKKNALFDLIHGNRLEAVNPAGVFQWYGVERLPCDIMKAQETGVSLANLVTEPIRMSEIIEEVFPQHLRAVGKVTSGAASYDVRTRRNFAFGGRGGYLQSKAEVMGDLRRFVVDGGWSQ